MAAMATAAHAAGTAPAAPISATMTARDAGSAQWFFAMAPDDVLPMLPVNTRLDMLDYYNSGIARESQNEAGSRAIVTSSTDRRITFEQGDSCTFELAVFTTARRDTLVAVIETVRFPMADSRINWYDARWMPRPAPFAEPRLADWLTREGTRRRAEAEEALPFITAEATASPEAGTVTFRRTIDSFFLPGQAPEALGLLHPEIVRKLK